MREEEEGGRGGRRWERRKAKVREEEEGGRGGRRWERRWERRKKV